MREEDLPFRCGRCGAFVGQERGHEADDFLPAPCGRCQKRGARRGGRAKTMTSNSYALPKSPNGFVACRSHKRNVQTTHLVALDEHGSNGGRPTVCGLTRFDAFDADGRPIPGTAGLPGWGMGDGGISGPGVTQVPCESCYALAGQAAGANEQGEGR